MLMIPYLEGYPSLFFLSFLKDGSSLLQHVVVFLAVILIGSYVIRHTDIVVWQYMWRKCYLF